MEYTIKNFEGFSSGLKITGDGSIRSLDGSGCGMRLNPDGRFLLNDGSDAGLKLNSNGSIMRSGNINTGFKVEGVRSLLSNLNPKLIELNKMPIHKSHLIDDELINSNPLLKYSSISNYNNFNCNVKISTDKSNKKGGYNKLNETKFKKL